MSQPPPDLGLTLHPAIADAVSQVMNAIPGAGVPLNWRLDLSSQNPVWEALSGQVSSEYDESEVLDILTGWARLLDLAQVAEPVAGTTEYRGTVDHRPITVWGITDRDVFDQPLPSSDGGAPTPVMHDSVTGAAPVDETGTAADRPTTPIHRERDRPMDSMPSHLEAGDQ
jgi:hypothetical protein